MSESRPYVAVDRNSHTRSVIVPGSNKPIDRELAEALHRFIQPVVSSNETQQSIRNVVIEIFAWIVAAALVWAVFALAL